MESEFVDPTQFDRLTLSGEDRWVDVKRELNAGEYDAMNASVAKEFSSGERPILDLEKIPSYKIVAYVIGWSFKDPAGHPVPVSAAAVANLRKTTRDEIGRAIEAHEAKVEQAIDERKNGQGDGAESKAISTSVAP